MKRLLQSLGIVLACLVVLMPTGANAAGYENIGGQAGYKEYDKWRYISSPASPGPEVAFVQYSGAPNLKMGIYYGSTYQSEQLMKVGEWRGVGYSGTPISFKIYATNTSSWNGDLNWD